MAALLSVFGIVPAKIGSQEAYARELSRQLGERGWRSILCFESAPTDLVRRYLGLPNVAFEVLERPEETGRRTLRALAAMLRRHRPDILHLYYTGFLGLYPWLARLSSVKGVFFTDHSSRPAFYAPHRAPRWKRALARLVNHPLSGVICVSGYGYRCMTAAELLPRHRFHLVYNAVDLDRVAGVEAGAQFRRRHGIPLDRPIVAQVSWMIPEKGIPDLLEATRLILAKDPDVQLVLVGDGDHRPAYMEMAQALGIEHRVTWTGFVPDPVGEGVYAAADVVCQVSRWDEVFGWVIAEAMAAAKPVVATAVGGIPELVGDGETGYLVPRGDVGQIADRILQLLASPGLRARFGQAGREAAAVKFDIGRNVAQVLALYGIS